MFDLITIGDTTVDTFVQIDKAKLTYSKSSHRPQNFCLPYGEKITIESIEEALGGNAANVAVGVTKLEANVALVSEIGDDFLGEQALSSLQEKKVDTSFVKKLKKKKTRASIALTYSGERTILSTFPPRSYSLPSLPKTQWIYYTSLGPSFEKLQKQLISFLKKNPHVQLASNPGSHQLHVGLSEWKKILPFTNVLFVNKEEAELLIGKKATVPVLFKKLLSLGVKNVVMTDSIMGSYTLFEGSLLHMPVFKVKTVSKTGAGDAFASGVLAGLIRGESMEQSLRWGTANASAVIQKLGAQNGLLSLRDLKKLLSINSSSKPVKLV